MSSQQDGLSRREILRATITLGSLTTFAGILAACGGGGGGAAAPAPTAAPAQPAPTTAPAAGGAAPTPTTAAAAAPTAAPAPTTAPAAAATAPAVQGTVTVRYGIHDDPKARQLVLDAFAKQYPNIKVTIEQIQDFPVKIPTMAAAGTLPDVVRMWESMVLDMARAGQLIPLDDLISTQRDLNPDDFIPVFWNYPVVNGKRYGIADVFAPHFTFYDKDLFAQAGVPEPKPDEEWTWDAYVAAAQKNTRPKDKIWGSDTIPIGWQYWTLKMVWQDGGDWFTPDYQQCLIDQPQSISTVQYWADLLLKGDLMPTPEQAQATANGQGGGFFDAGHVALGRWGIWLAADLLKQKFKWNFVPEPKKTERATILHTAFNAITKTTKNRDASWTWLNEMVSTEGTFDYAHQAAFPSVRKSANEKKPWILDANVPVNWAIIPLAGEYGRVLPGPHNEDQALKLIGDALQAIYLGKRKAADVFKEIAPKVTSVIRLS